jgi:hypothetical protein
MLRMLFLLLDGRFAAGLRLVEAGAVLGSIFIGLGRIGGHLASLDVD